MGIQLLYLMPFRGFSQGWQPIPASPVTIMFVSIYHMIRDDEDFHPVDYEHVVTRRHEHRAPNVKNVMDFLGNRRIDDETIRLIEKQCSRSRESDDDSVKETEPAPENQDK